MADEGYEYQQRMRGAGNQHSGGTERKIMFERKNAYVSFATSLLIHGMLGVFYLHITQIQKDNILLLENIEFIEIEADIPITRQMQMPAQALPKSVLDFVKMALPVFKKPEFQEMAATEETDKKDLMEPQKK